MADHLSSRVSEISSERRSQLYKKLLTRKNGRPSADRGTSDLAPIPRRPEGVSVLSFGQERLWFLQLLEPESTAYNIGRAFRFAGAFDTKRFIRAYQLAVARQEVLRTRILNEGGRPVAVLSPEISGICLVEVSGGEDEVQRLLSREAQRPFSLEREPMIRAALYRASTNEPCCP